MNIALNIKDRLDNLYNEVLNGKQEIFLELDQLIVEILKLKEIEPLFVRIAL